jgi:hypothetical protein
LTQIFIYRTIQYDMFFVFNTIIYVTNIVKTNLMILLRIVLLIRCLRFLSTKEELDVVLLINMEYVCNNNVVIDKNVILNIENICYDKFKEKWYNDLITIIHVTSIIKTKSIFSLNTFISFSFYF